MELYKCYVINADNYILFITKSDD